MNKIETERPGANPGVLPYQELRDLAGRAIRPAQPLTDAQLQPASLDLRLGTRAYRVRASFLPGPEATVVLAELAAGMPDDPERLRTLSAALNETGEVLVVQGNLADALKTFQDSLAVADRLAKADPSNADWERNLSIPYERVGDVLVAQGNLAEALASYQDSLDIRGRLAESERLAAWFAGLATGPDHGLLGTALLLLAGMAA